MTEVAHTQAPVSAAGFDAGAAGITPPSNPNRRGAFLTDVIVELGFADRETVDKATEAARQSEKAVEQLLLNGGILDEHQLSLAIAERNGLDHVDLDCFEVDVEAMEMVSRSVAQRYRAVPIAFAPNGALIVVVEDLFALGISDIEVMTKTEVRPAIAVASGIQGLIERLPEESPVKLPPPVLEIEPDSSEEEKEEWPEPSAAPAPQASLAPSPPPEPAPAPQATPAPSPPPDPSPAPNGNLGDLSLELRTLQETARRADALAVTVERRIEELEGADERAQRLEQELATARERIAELESRLSGVDSVAGELRATTEKLTALNRVLEESAGGSDRD